MRDIHSHIIFDVDDGADSLDESIAMLCAARNAGVTELVATPHCHRSHFDEDRIRDHFAQLKPYAHDIDFRLGFEVNYRRLVIMDPDEVTRYAFEGSNEFLLELSNSEFPFDLERQVFMLRGKGLDVIIAHPERYAPVQDDIDNAHMLLDMGCKLQLSADCFAEGRFSKQRRCAMKLLKEGLVSFVGSDAHCVEDYRIFMKAPAMGAVQTD